MARWVRFYRLPPADYWSLTVGEDAALEGLMQQELEARRRG